MRLFILCLQLTSSFMTRMMGFWASMLVARHCSKAPMSWRVGASTRTKLRTDSSDWTSSADDDSGDRSSLVLGKLLWFELLFMIFCCCCANVPPEAILGAFCCFLVVLLSGLSKTTSSPVAVRRMSTRSGINFLLLRCQETVASGLPELKREEREKWQIRLV